jgi:hypothetical protein
MRTGRIFASAVVVVSMAAAAHAQQPKDTVVEVHRVTPRPGMRAQLEAGRAKHMAWHKQQGDTWAWHVWEVTTGPETGSYIVGSPGHQWTDFDAWNARMAKGDSADAAVNLQPYQESSEMSYWVMLADASRPPAQGSQLVMATFTTYHLKPGTSDRFREAMRTISAALDKGNFPLRSIWYSLANGGPVNTYAVLTPRASMADMALPQPTLRQVVETSIGRAAADAAFDAFSDSVESGSSELLQLRPDLSYLPPSS